MRKKDYVIAIILCLIFMILSFYKLGDNYSIKTYGKYNYNDSIVLELDSVSDISKLMYFNIFDNLGYDIYISDDDINYEYLTFIDGSCFNWNEIVVNRKFKYLKLLSYSDNNYLGEIALFDKDNNYISVIQNETNKLIIDEENLIPDSVSYMNSMYFDEVYFAKCAYEYLNKLPASEWTHPPLAKLIQMIPIYFLGMNPFAYRLTSVISGAILVYVMYYFAFLLFGKRKYALISGILLVFENLHFTLSRIGTSDSILVLFMCLSCLFMYKYIMLKKDDDISLKIFNLFLSGLFFAFSITVKWTGFYMGLGICILFFVKLISEIICDKKLSCDNIKIILSCILFFILVPCSLYLICYFKFPNLETRTISNLSDLFNQIKDMYLFHSTLSLGHPFSSLWYSWPIMYKPIWFYVYDYGNGIKSTISSLGNIVIWYSGIISFVYVFIKGIKKLDKNALILITIILCLFLPYAFIGRVMFLYHYYPVIFFLILCIVMLIRDFLEKYNKKYFVYIYLFLVIITFFVFYPVSSGISVGSKYIDGLKWFSSWIF